MAFRPRGQATSYASWLNTEKRQRCFSPWAQDRLGCGVEVTSAGSGGEESQRSWGRASGCTTGLLAPWSVAHAGGEGRAGVRGAEDAPARVNCGGAGAGQRRRLLKSERRRGGAGVRGALEGLLRLRVTQGAAADKKGVLAASACEPAVQRSPRFLRGRCGSRSSKLGSASRRGGAGSAGQWAKGCGGAAHGK
jgi:hypothetical protein